VEVAYVTFDGFYAASLARSDPDLGKHAFALLHKRTVLDSSPKARKIGIRPGIAASEARYAARGRQVRFLDYKEEYFCSDSKLWLDICAEYTSSIEQLSPHSAFLDLSMLAGAREMAVPLAADIYRAVRVCPHVGIASSKLTAKLAQGALYAGCDASYLAPLPIESLWQVDLAYLRRLKFLGYRTIGEVARLPSEILLKQFGKDGLHILLCAKGIDPTPVKTNYPRDEVSAKFVFMEPAQTDAHIEAGLRVLAQALSTKLHIGDRQTRDIELYIEFETCATTTKRVFVSGMQRMGTLLTGLRLTLRQVSLNKDVYAIAAKLKNVTSSSRKQLALEESVKDVQNAHSVMNGLHFVFGQESIRIASDIAPSRRKRLLQAYSREQL
jgi:DNA polymerase-4